MAAQEVAGSEVKGDCQQEGRGTNVVPYNIDIQYVVQIVTSTWNFLAISSSHPYLTNHMLKIISLDFS